MSKDNNEMHCVEPFGVDGNELDGLSPQMIFTLGVEWEMVRQKLESSERESMVIHIENKSRVEAMMKRNNRKFFLTYLKNDVSESWVSLLIEEK